MLTENCLTTLCTFIFYFALYNVALLILLLVAMETNSSRDSMISNLNMGRSLISSNLIMVALLSLAGIPPFGGFFAKVNLLSLLLNEFFFFWFLSSIALLLFGIFFYVSNLRPLLSPLPISAPNVRKSFRSLSIQLCLVVFLLTGPLFSDDVLILIAWIFS